ncbi:MAG: type III pantothenate kinase [Crocinitomicaceae bacterium]|nr:type III pantothenate kinase [Crocinitomicaceae bacterium]
MKNRFQIVIDQGNSFTKIAVFSGKELLKVQRLTDEQVIETAVFPSGYDKFSSGIYSSVRAEKDQIIPRIQLDIPLLKLSVHTPVPVKVDYETPATLGMDRLANACGAHSIFPGQSSLVIDCGSCITYTMIVKNTLTGGAISPGLRMRYKSLYYFTGRLPLLNPDLLAADEEIELLGKSTEASLHSGVINGVLEEMNGMIGQFCSLFNPLNVLLTGGDMSFFEQKLKTTTFAHQNLTLTGLHEILEYNCT